MKTTVAIAEDQQVIRSMLKDMIADSYNMIYAASSAESLLRYLQSNPTVRHPQLILMDIAMDGMSGIAATQEVKQINPNIKVIMLTSFEDDDQVFEAIQSGADGYCIKDEMVRRLKVCMDDVVSGGSYMSPGIARKAMQLLQKTYTPASEKDDSPLTRRETEILQMVIKGDSAACIAKTLTLSIATVKSHIYNVYKKLQVSNKMEAANLVRSKGWLT